jgi:curli biogenesis system outer membrane secretion channel CsgG
MWKSITIVLSALAALALPLSIVAAQADTPAGGSARPSGQGPDAWRGPKVRVGVMDLTGSAVGTVATMDGAGAMQPGTMALAPAGLPGQAGVPAGMPGQVVVTGGMPGQVGVPAGMPGQVVVPGGMPGQVGVQTDVPGQVGVPGGLPVQPTGPPPSGTGGGVIVGAVGGPMPGQQPVMMQQSQPVMMQQPQPVMMQQPQPVVMEQQEPAMTAGTAYPPGSIPPPPALAAGLTEMLTTALTQQSQFVVLERSKVDQVVNEQNFGASGRVDPASAPQVGKVLGAQVLIFGDITEFSEHLSSVGGGFNVLKSMSAQVGGSVSKVTAQVAIDLRLVDAVTGQVISSVRGEGRASATGIAANFQTADDNIGAGGSAQTPLGQASRSAIASAVAGIVQGMQKVSWSGRVVDVRGGEIYINGGATQGIATGMVFDIYSQGEQLVDPDTHLPLGTPDQRIGGVTIVSVAPQYAVGHVTDGTGMKRSDVVRFKGSGTTP